MIHKSLKLIAHAFMFIVIAALAACHSDKLAKPPSTKATVSPLTSPQPISFVGTVPMPRSEEAEITPMESVAAARN